MNDIRHLSLEKGKHRYTFRWKPGREADVIDAFAAMAEDDEYDFDWNDSAVLSYQMGRRLQTELEQ